MCCYNLLTLWGLGLQEQVIGLGEGNCRCIAIICLLSGDWAFKKQIIVIKIS